MDFLIKGGRKLSGSVTTNVSKNAALVLLIASLLNRGETTLKRIPKIEEVFRIIEVLQSLGISVNWQKNGDIKIIPSKKIDINRLNKESARKTRSILMFLAPLSHIFSKFTIPYPGGCALGSRTVAPHVFGLEKFGIRIKEEKNGYLVRVSNLKPAYNVLYESGDTVTENVLMAAARIKGKTTIKMASANYQVQDLCFFLKKLGVKIEGIGTTSLTVHGKQNINKNVVYAPAEDPIESMLFLSIAATTNSSINIKRCPIDFLELELLKLEKMGFKFKLSKRYKSKNGFTDLVDIKTHPSKLKALEEKIYARPFPGINIDNLPFFVPIALKASGETLIHDWVYEGRAVHYLELEKLGAKINLADPHRVFIKGPAKLKGAKITCPSALRPAAIILIAMLAAQGTSTLKNVYSINRGYEDIASRLNKLGAKVVIIS